MINKCFLEDMSISLRAKGLLAYCLSKPDGWKFYPRQMAKVLKEGRDAIYSTFNELIESGYLIRQQQKVKGKFQQNTFMLYEAKIKESLPRPDFPDTEPPDTDQRDTAIDKDLVSNDRLNNEGEGDSSSFLPSSQHKIYYKSQKSSQLEQNQTEKKNFGKYVSLREGEYEELCNKLSKSVVDEYISAINDYVPNRSQGPYSDYAAAIRQWHRRDKQSGKVPKVSHDPWDLNELIANNKAWFREYIKQYQRPNLDETYTDHHEYIQFRNLDRNTSSPYFYFKDSKFKDFIKDETAKRLYVIKR